ncbi:ricin-type beta-trefoil lectin domain protein [Ramlibacter humi]|uniref:Ricin B lectin domain-containing protein n=1 Tax=Ramlibacter humi TaxID=2530451 RepID=A0A4Z0BHY4_9BURK|nr:ricin-type beta-trefoil lectin domain protein [Ramlibacter humi]TFY97734.1 hypothetical protein EZ216_18635 [Ramlibacter humi]
MRSLASSIALLAFAAATAHAGGPVNYISSSSGYMLHMSGNSAVTANWQGQAPIQGFSGYGTIQVNGRCLTGRAAHAPLTWEACKGDQPQKWSLSGGRLKNEGGWCADVQGNRGGAGVPVLAWDCTGAVNQQWRSHYTETAQAAAAKIANPQVRAEFLKNATSAAPGTVISTSTGKIVAQGGGNIVAQGGGNIVAQGGGNIVAQGGGN